MRSKVNNKFILSAVIFLLVAVVLFPLRSRVIEASQNLYNKWMVLSVIIEKIERFYVIKPETDELFNDAINGILHGLDPHSVYLTKEQYDDWKKQYEGYLGIGIKYQMLNGEIVVVSIMKESPAEKAGLKIGDSIIQVEGRDIREMKNKQIKDLLLGPPHSFVIITRKDHKSGETTDLKLERAYVQPSSVPCAFNFPDSTGYIKIAHFTQSTPTELDLAFAELKSAGMSRLILDLRDNSGGDFNAGIAVADRFVPAGKLIVFTKGRAPGTTEQFIATAENSFPSMPLAVMVNEATASDAEIVAAAIQDWKIGKIVGQPTFGKGLIQTEFPLQDGSALLLSTAQFFSPRGKPLQKIAKDDSSGIAGGTGVIPDITLETETINPTPLLKTLYFGQENYFFRYATEFVSLDSLAFGSINDYIDQFRVNDQMLLDFYQHLAQWDFPVSNADLTANASLISMALKREIAGRLWGMEGKYAVDVAHDGNVLKTKRLLKGG